MIFRLYLGQKPPYEIALPQTSDGMPILPAVGDKVYSKMADTLYSGIVTRREWFFVSYNADETECHIYADEKTSSFVPAIAAIKEYDERR